MKCFPEKVDEVKVKLVLEDYIPLKIIVEGKEELVDVITYSKGTRSLLEIIIRRQSKSIKEITLLISEEYCIFNQKINAHKADYGNANLRCKDYKHSEVSTFRTNVFEDGVQIVLYDEKSAKYVKMGRLYVGLSDTNELTEIGMEQLSEEESAHIKTELDFSAATAGTRW